MMFPLSSRPQGINPDGTVTIFCVQCGKEICRRVGSQSTSFRTATCLTCQGYPKSVTEPKYVQVDPSRPPIPMTEFDPISLYPDEQELMDEAKRTNKPWTGILKPLFRAIGWVKDEEQVVEDKQKENLPSRKLARKKFDRDGGGGLFER